jgi:predicted transcriptional regulator of viral defense system
VVDLVDLPPTFTTGTARRSGVHTRNLYRWRDDGQLVELSRGVFRQSDAPEASFPELLAVAFRAPNAVACLMTAAYVHDLLDEIPSAVQIAVPRRSRAPRISYPAVEVFHFDSASFELGLESFEVALGEHVRLYGPARTVVDLFRFRRLMGEPSAYIALRRYLAAPGTRPRDLLDLSGALNVLGPVRAAVDVLLAS